MTADELIERFHRERLNKLLHTFGSEPPENALQDLNEACESQLLEDEEGIKESIGARNARRLYAFFRFLVDDSMSPKWQALREDKKLDRDDLVVRVWRELETTHQTEVKNQYHSLEYHRLWLFDWLLRRYDIRRAREVVGGGKWWVQNAHLFLLGGVVAVLALRQLEWLGADKTWGALLFCGFAYAAVLVVLAIAFSPDGFEAFAMATHSLIPRLAGAGAVGLVILASSGELLTAVLDTKPWWLLGLLIAGYGYLLLEMARRIHPLPRARRLILHGFDVATTAFAHSMTLALLAEGGLRRVLADPAGKPFSLWQSLSVVVFVFSIGLVVNLIWAEQPVTEPL